MNVFDELDRLKQANRELVLKLEEAHKTLEPLKAIGINNKNDSIKHIAIFKRYKTRSGKYDESKKKIELVINEIGIKKYNKIVANWKQELVKDRMI